MKYLPVFAALLGFPALALVVPGCASNSAVSIPAGVARTSFDVRYGEVVTVTPVRIEGEPTAVGRLGGAVIGYALGRGNSPLFEDAHRLETAVGSVAGTVAGEAVERHLSSEDGLQVVVRLDDRATIAVVQAADVAFMPGDRVRVLFGRDGSTRVQPR
jgi:outer membrane lipoprotein SlyB